MMSILVCYNTLLYYGKQISIYIFQKYKAVSTRFIYANSRYIKVLEFSALNTQMF